GPGLPPLSTATTPWPAMPVRGSRPIFASSRAITWPVRCSRLDSSGCWWKSRRQGTTCACSFAAAASTSGRGAAASADVVAPNASRQARARECTFGLQGMGGSATKGRGPQVSRWPWRRRHAVLHRLARCRTGRRLQCRSYQRVAPHPMPELALQLLLLLFLAGLLAGFIDSIAGGGGMITIPAMLLAGIPPLQVLGTNKLQSLFGAGTASWTYARHGHVDLRAQLPMALT